MQTTEWTPEQRQGAYKALVDDFKEQLTPAGLEKLLAASHFLTDRDFRTEHLLALFNASAGHQQAFEKLLDQMVEQRQGEMPPGEAIAWIRVAFRVGTVLGFQIGDDWRDTYGGDF